MTFAPSLADQRAAGCLGARLRGISATGAPAVRCFAH